MGEIQTYSSLWHSMRNNPLHEAQRRFMQRTAVLNIFYTLFRLCQFLFFNSHSILFWTFLKKHGPNISILTHLFQCDLKTQLYEKFPLFRYVWVNLELFKKNTKWAIILVKWMPLEIFYSRQKSTCPWEQTRNPMSDVVQFHGKFMPVFISCSREERSLITQQLQKMIQCFA